MIIMLWFIDEESEVSSDKDDGPRTGKEKDINEG